MVPTPKHPPYKTARAKRLDLIESDPIHRVLNALVLISVLGLTLTALPLHYSHHRWAQAWALAAGGQAAIRLWHRIFAGVAMASCAVHGLHGILKIVGLRAENTKWGTILFGPDSHWPKLRDARDLLDMGRWAVGLGRRPRFEHWTYWEKFDYWAILLLAVLMGISGWMLWQPDFFYLLLPHAVCQAAQGIHREFGLRATCYLLLFHYYLTHFRPQKFPFDLSVLTGRVSEQHLRRYRPEYVERLFREGKLDAMRRPATAQPRRWFVFLANAVSLLMGLYLLALALLVSLEN